MNFLSSISTTPTFFPLTSNSFPGLTSAIAFSRKPANSRAYWASVCQSATRRLAGMLCPPSRAEARRASAVSKSLVRIAERADAIAVSISLSSSVASAEATASSAGMSVSSASDMSASAIASSGGASPSMLATAGDGSESAGVVSIGSGAAGCGIGSGVAAATEAVEGVLTGGDGLVVDVGIGFLPSGRDGGGLDEIPASSGSGLDRSPASPCGPAARFSSRGERVA